MLAGVEPVVISGEKRQHDQSGDEPQREQRRLLSRQEKEHQKVANLKIGIHDTVQDPVGEPMEHDPLTIASVAFLHKERGWHACAR